MTGLAVVDCSASSDTIVILHKVVELGGCIVLANKKPLTSSMVMISYSYAFSDLWVGENYSGSPRYSYFSLTPLHTFLFPTYCNN